jgi:hypothetical protein
MSAQPEPNPAEGSGTSTASFPPGLENQPIRSRASAVVLPLWPSAAAHDAAQAPLAPNDSHDRMVEAADSRVGAARGLLLGLFLGGVLWLLIGLAVWRLLLH